MGPKSAGCAVATAALCCAASAATVSADSTPSADSAVSARSSAVARAGSPYAKDASAALRRTAHVVLRIDVPRIDESSSLAVSTEHPGLVYTMNDSGDGPFVYVLDDDGRLVGITTLRGVRAVDIEALSVARDGSLVVGDIGDNDGDRSSIQVYRISQPTAGFRTVTPDKVTLTYADGARNAESILYDAHSGRVLVVSKEIVARVYTTRAHVFAWSSAALRRLADAPTIATDASWLPADGGVVVRTYGHAFVYDYPSWKREADFTLPRQQQGESIANVPGRPEVVWVGSEGVDSPVWAVPLPKLPIVAGHALPSETVVTATAGSASVRPAPPPADTADHGDVSARVASPGAGLVVGAGVGVALVVAGAATLGVRAARRRGAESHRAE